MSTVQPTMPVLRIMPAAALPDNLRATFAVVGAQKAGTTSLHDLLGQHPEVWTSAPKETRFFSYPSNMESFPDPALAYSQYHRFFAGWAGEPAVGEAHPGYMIVPHAARKLCEYNPSMKLIFILRDPAERAHSHYWMQARSGIEKLDFADALAAEQFRLGYNVAGRMPWGRWLGQFAYATRGLYITYIKQVLEYFPVEQMHFMRTEDLQQDMPTAMRSLYRFLGVDDAFVPASVRLLEGNYESTMGAADLAFLREFHDADTCELETFLHWDLTAWKAIPPQVPARS